jgi:hypothetical protein
MSDVKRWWMHQEHCEGGGGAMLEVTDRYGYGEDQYVLASDYDALANWIDSLRERMGKEAEPWLGVRADIIPPSVQSIVAWYNEANMMIRPPPTGRDC